MKTKQAIDVQKISDYASDAASEMEQATKLLNASMMTADVSAEQIMAVQRLSASAGELARMMVARLAIIHSGV